VKAGIIPMEANDESAQYDPALRIMLDDLVHAGHVIVDAPDVACNVWLAATRRYPESEIVLSRPGRRYRIEMLFRRNL